MFVGVEKVRAIVEQELRTGMYILGSEDSNSVLAVRESD
jgi:hypothetical protein